MESLRFDCCMYCKCSKLRRLSKKLPDVIGTWKYENGGGNPGGAGPDTELHDIIQPTTTLEMVADPTYLQPAETVLVETTITPVSASPQVHEKPPRTTILFNPGSMERRNRNGQVCISVSSLSVSSSGIA